jgi:hypothetical protein
MLSALLVSIVAGGIVGVPTQAVPPPTGPPAAPPAGPAIPIGPEEAGLIAEAEQFEEGETNAIPLQDTLSASFTLTTELLPSYEAGFFASGTTGQVAVGTDGAGFQVSFDESTIDIAILQLEPDDLKVFKDAINTIDFTAKLTAQGAPHLPPTLEFGLDLQGQEPGSETPVSMQICFRDTMDKVEMLVAQMEGAMLPPPMRRLMMAAPPAVPAAPAAAPPTAAPAVPAAPAACADDPVWTDSYGDSCDWYAINDPGCVYYTQPDGDYGQFEHCKVTCGTCAGPVQTCPPEPTIHSDGTAEHVHFCIPPEEGAEISSVDYDGVTLTKHVVSAADFSFAAYGDSMDLTFSLTGPDSPEFELKGHLVVESIVVPNPASLAALPEPAYCTQYLTVEMLAQAAAGPVESLEQGRLCDFTGPSEEPCCAEQTFEAQDACLAAKATGSHLCDHTNPTVEPCCQEQTHEAQDSCLALKGVTIPTTRKLGGSGVDELSKRIALRTLKKLHSAKGTAKEMFKDYKDEKARMVRKALIEYSVAGVVALLFALGALRYCNVRKSYVVASTDEEMFVEAGMTTVTE